MSSLEQYLINSPYLIRELFINVYGYRLSQKRFNTSFKKFLDELLTNLNKTPEQVKSDQLLLLKNTLIHAYANVPFYTKLFNDIEFNPYDFSSEDELKKIPILDKITIRSNFDQLCNPKIPKNKFILHQTSGSTGEKLKFFQPKVLTYTVNAAFMYRFYSLHGIKPKDKRVTIGGRRFTNRPPFWSYNRAENQLLLSSHHLNSTVVIDYINKINTFNPKFIQGHPNSILYISNFILSGKARLTASVKAIFTTGETLSEENRTKIELAFNTGVFQQYGSGESCFSAQETPERNGYLLNYEHGFVELIGKEEYKEVIATSFQNNVMPFIRYRVGDLVKPVKVEVLSKYPFPILFDEILGRIDDILKNINGEDVLPVTVRMSVKPFLKEFTNYQLIQLAQNDFHLKLIDNKREIDVKSLTHALVAIFDSNIQLRIEYVDSIVSEGGKIRNIINRIGK